MICVNEIQQIGGSIEYGNTGDLIEDAKLIIDSAQRSAHQAVNVALVVRNWLLGRRIAEEELGGDTRLELYGRKVVPMLAKELTATYGKGYTRTSLYQYVQFYRMFPEIVHAASGQSHVLLTWTHYRELLRVQNDEARAWYEREAASQGWSVKQLSLEMVFVGLVDDSVPLALDGENLVDLVMDELQWRSLAKILDLHWSGHSVDVGLSITMLSCE